MPNHRLDGYENPIDRGVFPVPTGEFTGFPNHQPWGSAWSLDGRGMKVALC